MTSLPRKNSEFLEMYREDIEAIVKPYGFKYEDRDEYYITKYYSAEEMRRSHSLYYKMTDYGKLFIDIGATGRLSEFRIIADLFPAIQEIANIEYHFYKELCMSPTANFMRWKEGADGIKIDLIPNSHIVHNKQEYIEKMQSFSNTLSNYLIAQTPRAVFENFLKHQPNFLRFDFTDIDIYRIGYWLILAKLAGEDYYLKYANKYVELNKFKIQEKFNVDITKLKDFLDTYTVGLLA